MTNTQAMPQLRQGLPPLGRRTFSNSTPSLNQGRIAKKQLSGYKFRLQQARDDLPVFHETINFDLEKCSLWNLFESGDFAENWKDQENILTYVQHALTYVRRVFDGSLGLVSRLIISKQLMACKAQPDVVFFSPDCMQTLGVCEIMVPQSCIKQVIDLSHNLVLYQACLQMLEMRQVFGTRFVIGIVSNYVNWRFLWFEDSNEAILEKDRVKFDQFCNTAHGSDAGVSDLFQSNVYYSRVYRHDENALISTLGTVLYKLAKSPQNVGLKFLCKRIKYSYLSAYQCTYNELPGEFKFSLKMPNVDVEQFFKFDRYRKVGGDGSVFMAADIYGRMCVIKSLHPDSEHSLEDEMRMWKLLYPRYDQICIKVLDNVKHLIMPLVFHARKYQIGDDAEETVIFCPPHAWNRPIRPNETFFNQNIGPELGKLDQNACNQWRDNPQKAMQYALEKIKQHGYEHQEAEWRNLALFPFPDPHRPGVWTVEPGFIDLTRVCKIG
ncbi:hypothetical protein MP228_009868 [Amoeboaphelidium protococcarum]|nr:hypothetical protein MP228_009868 [Amoeboaphelidium protococcarum]